MNDNTKGIVIDKAMPADAPVIIEVQRRTWLDTYPNEALGISREAVRLRMEGEQGERIAQKVKRWHKAIIDDDSTRATFVARVAGQVIGFTAPIRLDGQKRLGALYVLPEFQGCGAGSLLLHKALAWHGTDEDVYIRVASYNYKAIAFYKRHGFVPTGRAVEDEGDVYGAMRIPEIEMALKLPARIRDI